MSVHVEVIRLALGDAAAFAVLRGPGYRKLIINTDEPPGRPVPPEQREAGIAEWVEWLKHSDDVPEHRETG